MKIIENYNYHCFRKVISRSNSSNALTRPSFTSKKINVSTLRGQKNCWSLHDSNIFDQFLRADEEIKSLASFFLKICDTYKLPVTIKSMLKFKEQMPELEKVINLIKSKYSIDLAIPPFLYRFVGIDEVNCLMKNKIVEPQRYFDKKAFDVTINPNMNWNDYRITFKPLRKFSILDEESLIRENLGTNHDYYYRLSGSYSLDDVENIEKVSK